MFEVVIIGSGASGISTALYLKRGGVDPLVLAKKDSGSLYMAKEIENYYGSGKIDGKTLHERGMQQAIDLGVDVRNEEVFSVLYADDGGYEITTDKSTIKAKYVVIATGLSRKTPRIEGISKFESSGISYCAVCDGFFYKRKPVAVFGAGKYALHEAEYLANIASEVFLLTNGAELDSSLHNSKANDTKLNNTLENSKANDIKLNNTLENSKAIDTKLNNTLENSKAIDTKIDRTLHNSKIKVIDKVVKGLEGGEFLEKVLFDGGESVAVDGFFIALKSAGATELAVKLGLELENGNIKTDKKGRTNIENVYAIGDCTGAPYQIAKAVYEGMIVASDILQSKKN